MRIVLLEDDEGHELELGSEEPCRIRLNELGDVGGIAKCVFGLN